MENNLVALYHDRDLEYPDKPFQIPNQISQALDFLISHIVKQPVEKYWNPLQTLVQKHKTVVIKPNFVSIRNHHFQLNKQIQLAVTTNRSLLIPLIEYAYRAVGSKGKIIIADSPLEASDFNQTMEKLGIREVVNHFQKKNYPLELVDLRDFRVKPVSLIDNFKIGRRSFNFGIFKKQKLTGDKSGYTCIDLQDKSHFYNYSKLDRLRFYKPHLFKPREAHNKKSHKYLIANSILDADLIISLPKMKTHKLAGVTMAVKNNIGLTNNKYWLPHYTAGYFPHGDQFDRKPTIKEQIQNFFRIIPIGNGNSLFVRFPVVDDKHQQASAPIHNGSWIGNDTLWRAILDIAKLVEYGDNKGKLQEKPQRKILNILDGIIAGEGNGPLAARPKQCGVLMASLNMYKLDLMAVKIMGFDKDKIKYLNHLDEKGVNLVSNVENIPEFDFISPDKWEPLNGN